MTQKMMRVVHEFTSEVRQRANGQYFITVPIKDVRAFFRKLPRVAHTASLHANNVSGRTYVPVHVSLTWEGLVRE